jgi:hypothetical protein
VRRQEQRQWIGNRDEQWVASAFYTKVLGFEGKQCIVDGGDSRLPCCRHAACISRLWYRH